MEGHPAVRPCFFLDRDGVIVEEVNYLSTPEEIRLIPGSPRAIALLNRAGIPVVVVTNQAGVARGIFPEDRVGEIHRELDRLLASHGARVDRYEYCPHHPVEGIGPYKKDCPNRKPAPGMLLKAAREMDLDLARSFLVGDKVTDLQAGEAAGCRTILVRTGYGARITPGELQAAGITPFLTASDLLEAVRTCLPLLAEEGKG